MWCARRRRGGAQSARSGPARPSRAPCNGWCQQRDNNGSCQQRKGKSATIRVSSAKATLRVSSAREVLREEVTRWSEERSFWTSSAISCSLQGAGFRVQGSGCRVQGAGIRDQGSGFRATRNGWCQQRDPHCNATVDVTTRVPHPATRRFRSAREYYTMQRDGSHQHAHSGHCNATLHVSSAIMCLQHDGSSQHVHTAGAAWSNGLVSHKVFITGV